MAYGLLEQALIADIELDYFWDSSYANIVLKLQAYNEKQRIDALYRASDTYTLARLIAVNMGTLLSKDAKVPTIQQCFPHLFDEEVEKVDTANSDSSDKKPKLSRAEIGFLNRMIAEQNLRASKKQPNKE